LSKKEGEKMMCFGGAAGWTCSMQWLVMVLLFFIAAMARRQLVDLAGVNFSLIEQQH